MYVERPWNNVYQGNVLRFAVDFSLLAVSEELVEICLSVSNYKHSNYFTQ